MTTNIDGCFLGYLYDNRRGWIPFGLFVQRKVLYHFSLSKVIPQKMKFNMEYITSDFEILPGFGCPENDNIVRSKSYGTSQLFLVQLGPI